MDAAGEQMANSRQQTASDRLEYLQLLLFRAATIFAEAPPLESGIVLNLNLNGFI
jgi:hypothetical protein